MQVLSLIGYVGDTMRQDAISEPDVELRTILRSRTPDVGWLMVHSDTDFEETRWVRVRAERANRVVQFVVIVPKSDTASNGSIAARIINEALHLLNKRH